MMSSFNLSRDHGPAPINLVHAETKSPWFLRVYPYYDNWPIYKLPTHYVLGFRLFGFWFQWRRTSKGFLNAYMAGKVR